MYKIPLVKHAFTNDLLTRLRLSWFILNNQKLTMGKKCFEFEEKFANFNKCQYSVLVNSGSSANLVLLQAMKNMCVIREGDTVAFNAVTWSTNVMPIIQFGFNPLPIDVSPYDLQIDLNDLNNKIASGKKIKFLFLTNALGGCANMIELWNICKDHDIKIIIDNCESLGLDIGKYALASTYSFYVSHHMTTVEGGAICTDDLRLSAECRMVREHGWIRNVVDTDELYYLGQKHNFDITKKDDLKFAFYDLAYNVRPTEITGFLGVEQLKSVKKNNKVRKNIYDTIMGNLLCTPEYNCCETYFLKNYIPFCLPIICESERYKIDIINKLESNGIETRPIIAGNICKQPFFQKYTKERYDLPGADMIEQNGFYIALRPDLTKKEIKLIIDCLR